MHAAEDRIEPQSVRIKQEVQLAAPNAFADIVVHVPCKPGYIVEVKYGHPTERIIESLSRKYRNELPWFESIAKLIVIFDSHNHPDSSQLQTQVQKIVPSHWDIELWDEHRLLAQVRKYFASKWIH
jgi:hypothetical protein